MKRALIIVLLAAGIIGAALYLRPEGGLGRHTYQGWIEADLLFIGPDQPGRLTELFVGEGDAVAKSAMLFAMEKDLQEADVSAASAAKSQARANLERAENAQQRPEEIAVLSAQEAQVLASIENTKSEFDRQTALVDKGISTRSRLDQARAAYDADKARLNAIRQQINVAGLAARSEDIESARQALAQAEAQLKAANTRLEQRKVYAPQSASVQEVYFRPGEIVPAGRPVVSLMPPEQMKVRFFVPQASLPEMAIGKKVAVSCDGCAASQSATIAFIAGEAEFTPPVIYSLEERAKLVFRLEARPDEPDKLRIGQPVTVTLIGDSE